MNDEVLKRIDTARLLAKVPFVITSGLRCRVHNKRVGGSPSSSHIDGLAVDIKADNSNHRHMILKGLLEAGFKRIGIAKNFIHADCDNTKPQQLTWLYK
jgi:uncharacterized protein YcbK (DUF882 family)